MRVQISVRTARVPADRVVDAALVGAGDEQEIDEHERAADGSVTEDGIAAGNQSR